MIKELTRAIAFITLVFYGSTTFAQLKKVEQGLDSLKSKTLQALKKDTASVKKALHFDQTIKKEFNQKIKSTGIDQFIKKDSNSAVKKVSLKDFSVENAIQYIRTESQSPSPNFINNISVSGQLELFKFPVNLDVVNNYNPLNKFDLSQQSLFKFDMVKPQIQQLYQSELNKYKNFKRDKLSGNNVETFLKNSIQTKLQGYMSKKLTNDPKLTAFLNNPQNVKDLLKLDEKQLKAKLTSLLTDVAHDTKAEGLSVYEEKKDLLNTELQAKVNEVAQIVQSVKKDINDSGLDAEKIEFMQKFVENKITQKDLEQFFVRELSRQPKLTGIQKFYSRIQEFQAGNFGNQLPGSFLNQNLFLNGVNFSLKTLRGPVNVGIATEKDIDQPKDAEFSRSTFSYPKLFTYISVPTTNFSFGQGKLSWVGSYDKQFSRSIQQLSTALPKNNLVFTISQNLNIAKLGKLTLDISKSATQYKNLNSIGPDRIAIDKSGMGNYFRDDFLETMSVGVNHGIDSKKMGLNSNVYFNYAGIGFQNPGQQGFANMNMRFGANIKQNLFKNKLSIYLKTDVKNTPISAENDAHWRNYTIQLDSRIRLSKSYSLNLKYIENGVNKVNDLSLPVYHSQKIQADFNANYKIGSHYSFSHITLGKQNIVSPGILQQPNFLTLNYAQSLLFKDFSLSGNVFYNRELNTSTILGNMINADAACQYTILRTFNLSTGLTYLDNQNIAKQVGVRQNVQLMLKKHFDVNAFLDLRKNLINPLYPDLFSTGRAEFSIRYYLDRQ